MDNTGTEGDLLHTYTLYMHIVFDYLKVSFSNRYQIFDYLQVSFFIQVQNAGLEVIHLTQNHGLVKVISCLYGTNYYNRCRIRPHCNSIKYEK